MSNSPFRPRYFLPGLLSPTVPDPQIDPQHSPLAQPGNGPIAGFTNTFSLNLVNFDWITWHNYEWENWIVVDALLNAAIGFLNIKGFWKPNTDYLAGQSVFDPENVNRLYLCLAPHTSGTDFDAEKPTYWKQVDQAKPPVSSVFGRIGDVVATAADYAAFYADKAATAAHIARNDNPHGTSWATLLDKPLTFPPAAHKHTEADITDLDKYTKAQVDALIASCVRLTGSTMTGFLTLSASPTALMHAANKGYVDAGLSALDTALTEDIANAVATRLTKAQADALYLSLTGGTLTGALTLPGPPSQPQHAATKAFVEQLIAGSGSATHVGDTPPTTPKQGQLWYRTVEPIGLFVWFVDADSSQWVQTSGSGSNSEDVPDFATIAEARAGTRDDVIMSPEGTTERIKAGEIALEGGYTAVNDADGTFSSGTYTPSPVGGNFKSISNAGPFTIAAPVVAGDYTMMILVGNVAGAGAIMLTGFNRVIGAFTTTVGHSFILSIVKIGAAKLATIQGLQ